MPTNKPDSIPIRAYVRNDAERQLVRDAFLAAGDRDARYYSSSAEGWVTPEGLKQLAAKNIIVDSLVPIEARQRPVPSAKKESQPKDDQQRPISFGDAAAAGGAELLGDIAMIGDKFFGDKMVSNLGEYASQAMDSLKVAADSLPEIFGSATKFAKSVVSDKFYSDLERTAREYVRQMAATAGAPSPTKVAPTPEPNEELFEVAVKVPIRPEWREALAQAGGGIVSYEPPNVFRIFLSPAEEAKIKVLDFVDSANRYDLAKSICPSVWEFLGLGSAQPTAEANVSNKTADSPASHVFEAILHRERDHDSAKAAIDYLGGKMVADSPTVLRFEAPTNPGMLAAIASRPEVKCLASYEPPRLFSNQARLLSGVERINEAFGSNPAGSWTGKDELVAVFDSGIDETHPDFDGQIQAVVAYTLNNESGTEDDKIGHGTHVAGIIAGTGAASGQAIRGVAPGAKLLVIGMTRPNGSLITPPDLGELLQEATSRGAKILNLSWGDQVKGNYDQGARQVDKFLYDNPEVLVVIAAGNAGEAKNGIHALKRVYTPACAKNAITVGACGSGHADVTKTYGTWMSTLFGSPVAESLMSDPDLPAALSSRGPTEYESAKPDVSACGVYVLAPRAANGRMPPWEPDFNGHNGRYVYLGGTSMAAPVVSGLAAIVRQYLRVAHGLASPTAALVKAILIASADRKAPLTAAHGAPYEDQIGYPDFHQGFGRVDLTRVLPHADAPAERKLLFDDVRNNSPQALQSPSFALAATNEVRVYRLTIPAGTTEPLRIVLTWTDVSGKYVQNNLNVYVHGPNQSPIIGNSNFKFLRDALFDNEGIDGVPFDKRNNVEHIKIENPVPGTYEIRVVAQSTPTPQGYAICVVGCMTENKLI